jgi:glycerol-3-phosphate acyltransferase PlsX
MIIAVDAMGGDHAPEVAVHGAIQACKELDINITLVGDSRLLSPFIKDCIVSEYLSIHHCEESIGMGESPIKAVRGKKDSSIRVAFDLLKNGKVDAVVSAGNSGAILAAGVLILGRIEGVDRPALASVIPGRNGRVVIINVGGNVDCRPEHLLQFGIMAEAFATSCLDMKQPRSGLLNIGTEPGKGNEQVRSAYELLNKSPLNFIGNVEGNDILSGDVQIVICDGFTGNIVLKFSEGMAEYINSRLRAGMADSIRGKAFSILGKNCFKNFEKGLDYAEYGGAPVLGIKGVGIVCHGHSSAMAIKNAIKMAMNYVSNKTGDKLAKRMAEIRH